MIAAADPRHGTYAGYQAHVAAGESPVRCDRCLVARRRHDKAYRLRTARGIPSLVNGKHALAAVDQWLRMGVTATVLDGCIGHKNGGIVVRLLSGDIHAVRVETLVKLRALSEDSIPDTALVYADLTRYRIFSLMAAGHRQIDMGINPRGRWRTGEKVKAGFARHIRDTYRRLEQTEGVCLHTATRAQNRGYLPPAGWDDPDTLAWPSECDRPDTDWPAVDDSEDYIDEAAVIRRIEGERLRLTRAEAVEVVRRWVASGRSLNECERVTGLQPHRYLRRGTEAA